MTLVAVLDQDRTNAVLEKGDRFRWFSTLRPIPQPAKCKQKRDPKRWLQSAHRVCEVGGRDAGIGVWRGLSRNTNVTNLPNPLQLQIEDEYRGIILDTI